MPQASLTYSCLGSGERLAPRPAVALRPLTERQAGDAELFCDPAHAFQEILGFGAAFTEAAAFALSHASPADQEAFLQRHFAPGSGQDYRLCRVHMGSCDFALGNWHHRETPDAPFSLAPDRKLLLPLVKRAKAIAGDRLRLFASPWSPPGWMKDTGIMNRGGKLLPQHRAAWAQCYVEFIQAYAAEGVPIWGVTVQNEPEAVQPWDSCVYTAEEERDFIRDFLAPALDRAGLGHIAIIGWDHNRDVMAQRAAVYYADPVVRARMWGVGFHWYVADTFDTVRLVHDCWPDKHLLFTEGCQEGGPHPGSWAVAERYATSIINDLNRWTCGWVDWNICLDSSGGPNHVGNLCSAPVLIDRTTGTLTENPSFAAIGHFSRAFAPGARRILCTTSRDDLLATACANPDGGVAVVLLHTGGTARRVRLQLGQRGALVCEVPGRALVTVRIPPVTDA